MNADWIVTARIRLRDVVDQTAPDAQALVRELITDECGFAGLCDWPDDYEILSVVPADSAEVSNVRTWDHALTREEVQAEFDGTDPTVAGSPNE